MRLPIACCTMPFHVLFRVGVMHLSISRPLSSGPPLHLCFQLYRMPAHVRAGSVCCVLFLLVLPPSHLVLHAFTRARRPGISGTLCCSSLSLLHHVSVHFSVVPPLGKPRVLFLLRYCVPGSPACVPL